MRRQRGQQVIKGNAARQVTVTQKRNVHIKREPFGTSVVGIVNTTAPLAS